MFLSPFLLTLPRVEKLRLRMRDAGLTSPTEELCSLFVVALPRSLSSVLYVAAARAVGLTQPGWTSDGEILNRDRVSRRLQSLAPTGERFTLPGSVPGVFASMSSYLDQVALRQGCAYKDVVQPFVVGGWDGLCDFKVLKVRRNVAEVAYAMLKRQWLYPAQAATIFGAHPWTLVEGLFTRMRCSTRSRARASSTRTQCSITVRSRSRSGGCIRRCRSPGFATSTAVSPGSACALRPNDETRSSSASSSGSSPRFVSDCAWTADARRSPRRSRSRRLVSVI